MKILKLLNNNYFSILFVIFLIAFNVNAEDKPVDIWNIDQNKVEETKSNNDNNKLETNEPQISQSSIYDLQSKKKLKRLK